MVWVQFDVEGVEALVQLAAKSHYMRAAIITSCHRLDAGSSGKKRCPMHGRQGKLKSAWTNTIGLLAFSGSRAGQANHEGQKVHPTPKPLALMPLVSRYGTHSAKAPTVLDPFMGSGTTGVACQQPAGILSASNTTPSISPSPRPALKPPSRPPACPHDSSPDRRPGPGSGSAGGCGAEDESESALDLPEKSRSRARSLSGAEILRLQ